jgi:hypothetical protein
MKTKKVLKAGLVALVIGSTAFFGNGCQRTMRSISSVISSINTSITSHTTSTTTNHTSTISTSPLT